MGKVNNQDVHSLDDYSKKEWREFLKQGAYRGLKINKVAKRLKTAQSCIYDKNTHQLDLISKKGKHITLDMDKLLRKNDRWTISRLIHNIKMCFSESDYAVKFNARIKKLAEAITKKTSDDFSSELSQFVNGDHNFIELKTFFNINLRTINESIGNQKIQDDLLILSHLALEMAGDAESRALAFQIQCTAKALIPDPNVVWEVLPTEVQKLIFSDVYQSAVASTDQAPNLHLISKQVKENISGEKYNWIDDNEVCLRSLGCKNAKEAVQYIIAHRLTTADLLTFPDFDDEDLQELSEYCPQLEKLAIYTPQFSPDKLVQELDKFPKLINLHLWGWRQLDGPGLKNMMGKLPKLNSLNLNSCYGISGNELAESLEMLPELKRLCLVHCPNISGIKLAEAIGTRTNLESLNVTDCFQIRAHLLVEAITKLPHINSLVFVGGEEISGDELVEIAKTHPMLRSLTVQLYPSNLSFDQFVVALGMLTHLEELRLGDDFFVDGDKLTEALGKLHSLQVLALEGCHQISGDHLVEIAEMHPMLRELSILECDQISDEKMDEAVDKLPMLQKLTRQKNPT